MTKAFDPYYTWLGIPPGDQPPTHYRLLGIDLFETNPSVIENAADRQIGFLRTLQAGAHVDASQRLLNEVSAARICLLSPKLKSTYDEELRESGQAGVNSSDVPSFNVRTEKALPGSQRKSHIRLAVVICSAAGIVGLALYAIVRSNLGAPESGRATATNRGSKDVMKPKEVELTKQLTRGKNKSGRESSKVPKETTRSKRETAAPSDLKHVVDEFKPGAIVQTFPVLPSQVEHREYIHPLKFGSPVGEALNVLDLTNWKPNKRFNEVICGYLKISEPGEYVFHTYTDWDRNALWINGELVSPFRGSVRRGTDPGGPDASKERITLPAGYAKFAFVVYSHSRVRALFRFHWKTPNSNSFTPVPNERLFHSAKNMDLKSLLNKAVVSKRLDGEKKGDKAMPANGGKTGRRAMDAETARRYQREIATRHGLPLESANAIGMRLALIPPGTFNTGDGSNDREVTFPRPFYLGILEVTQTQFQAVMDRNPSKFSGEPNLPTEMVTQAEAIEFCNQLSRREGLPACYHLSGRTRMVGDVKRNVWEMDLRAIGYRLPTDAEWEYACRAGSTAGYHFGNDSSHAERHGWFRVNSNQKTHPVGQKLPTPWGLFDMHGNVWEYCHPGEFDRKAKARYSIDEWIVRGASWLDDHEKWGGRLRDRFRIQNPSHRGHNVGFRVLRAAR